MKRRSTAFDLLDCHRMRVALIKARVSIDLGHTCIKVSHSQKHRYERLEVSKRLKRPIRERKCCC